MLKVIYYMLSNYISFYMKLFTTQNLLHEYEHARTFYIEPTNAFKRTVYLLTGIFVTLFLPHLGIMPV